MANEWTVEFEGKTHIYTSDLPDDDPMSRMSCDEWVESQSDEAKSIWIAFMNGQSTPESSAIYHNWMTACKITHTVKDGETVEFTNSYK